MLDEASNPVAQQFDQMIARSEATHRQALITQMNDTSPAPVRSQQPMANAPPTDYWFMSPQASTAPRPGKAAFAPAQVQLPGSDSVVASVPSSLDEEALASQLKANNSSKQVANTHLRTIQPLGSHPPQPPVASPVPPPSPAPPDPAILSLANNNDLNVATLAREARKAKHDEPPQSDEVVISLH